MIAKNKKVVKIQQKFRDLKFNLSIYLLGFGNRLSGIF